MFLACSPDSSKSRYFIASPDMTNDKVEGDTNSEIFDGDIDILFVIDDSGSMDTHQTNLVRNIDRFVNAFLGRANVNYRIGVITSSFEASYYSKNCCGKLVGSPNVVDSNTPTAMPVLSRNLLVGTSGSGLEKVFDPIRAALTSPLVDTENAGFYRPNAYLAVIFITDAEDQSSMNPDELYNFLVDLKGQKSRILSYGVVIPSSDTSGCARDEYNRPPARIEKFLDMMPNAGRNLFSLCDPNFGDSIAAIAEDLVDYVGSEVFLSRLPIPSTIEVSFGSQMIPMDREKGWTYNPSKNAIGFGKKVQWSLQPTGTRVKVSYEVATPK